MKVGPAEYRKLLGLNQIELAKLFGMSVQSISRKENALQKYTDEEKVF